MTQAAPPVQVVQLSLSKVQLPPRMVVIIHLLQLAMEGEEEEDVLQREGAQWQGVEVRREGE